MKELSPYTLCPRFNSCNVNICPLDPDQSLRNYLPGEPKCTMEKGVRLRLGANLPNFGLKPLELKGKQRWDALSPEAKEAKRSAGRALGLKQREKRLKTQGTMLLNARNKGVLHGRLPRSS